MYFSLGSRTGAVHSHRGPRRRGSWRAGWLTAAVLAALASGCSPAAPTNPDSPVPSTSVTASPTPISPSPAPATSNPPSTPPSTAPSTSTEPPGVVVPFRTVVPDSAAGQRIGLVAAAGSDPFSKAVTESITTQVDAAGAELIHCDPGADATLVLVCARRLATQRVDGWIVLQPGDVGAALCEAGPRDVPMISIAAPVSCQTAEVGADDERAGFLVGTALGLTARIRNGCASNTLIVLADSATTTVGPQRAAGIRAGINDQCPRLTNEVLLDAGTPDRAYASFTNALTALPDDADILVAAVDDGAALGAAAAIPAARAAHITLAGIGADQRARCEIVANPRWTGDAALFPDRYGEVAVPALLDAIQGRELPGNMYVETKFVTADSLGDYYDLSDCPVR